MNRKNIKAAGIIFILAIIAAIVFFPKESFDNKNIISYIADSKLQNLKFYWQDENGKNWIQTDGNLGVIIAITEKRKYNRMLIIRI